MRVLFVASFVLLGVGFVYGQVAHQHHPPSSDEYAKVLEDPERDGWQKPHEVLMALQLKASDVVADIGAGTGYFSRRLAMHAAKVYAVDIDAKLLEIANKNAPSNLMTIVSKPQDPMLPRASVDLIFFCDVIHHIADRVDYYRRLRSAMKPGGRIVVVDFYKKPLAIGPPPEMKLTEDEVTAEMKLAGFHLTRKEAFLEYQYFLEFR
jgi:ubiquinone/menaquinone biosynthesis C-methylase UbiE